MENKEIHQKHIEKILKNLFESEISDYIAFKGGTLVYLKYGLDRFSTDIDLDLLDISKENEVKEKINYLLLYLGDIKNFTQGKGIHRWIFSYDPNYINIKVELNKRIWKNNEYEENDINGVNIKTMKKSSIFANKLVALYERNENRDLYDVNFFLKNSYDINESIITERTGLSINALLEKLIDTIPRKYKTSTILHKLGEVVDEKQKNYIKKNLINDTVENIKVFLNNT